jgi:hypothetical protein
MLDRAPLVLPPITDTNLLRNSVTMRRPSLELRVIYQEKLTVALPNSRGTKEVGNPSRRQLPERRTRALLTRIVWILKLDYRPGRNVRSRRGHKWQSFENALIVGGKSRSKVALTQRTLR